MSSRASAITPAGIVLSQPTRQTSPSKRCPAATSSIESAMTSREISDARMPDVPIETPSEIAVVFHSIGIPPAARIPSLTERGGEILAAQADRLEHRARGRAIDAVGERRAAALGGVARPAADAHARAPI